MSRGLLNLAFSQRPIIEAICEYVPNAARILREAGFTVIHSALQVQRRVPKLDFAMADYYIDGLFIGSTNISGVSGVSVTLSMSLFSPEMGPLYHLAMVPAVQFSQIARSQSHPTHVHKPPHEISFVPQGSFIYVHTRQHANGIYGIIAHHYDEGTFWLYSETVPQEIRRIAYSDVTRFSVRVHDQDFGHTAILPLTHVPLDRITAVEALINAHTINALMPLQNVVTQRPTEDLSHHLKQANAFVHMALLMERQHELETLANITLDRFASRCWNHDHETTSRQLMCAYGEARLVKTRCRHPKWTQESVIVNDRVLETVLEVALRHIELQKSNHIKFDLPLKIMARQNVATWVVDTGSSCDDTYSHFS